jgi:hypothetical protein
LIRCVADNALHGFELFLIHGVQGIGLLLWRQRAVGKNFCRFCSLSFVIS